MSETKSPLGGLTRRGFLKTTGAVTAVAAVAGTGAALAPMPANAEGSSSADGEQTFRSACRGNCGSRCPLEVTVREGKVVKARPMDMPGEDAVRKRFCVKGFSQPQRVYDTDRLKYPMKRVGERGAGEWERISWDEAVSTIAEKMGAAIKDYGGTSVAVWSSYGSYGVLNGAMAGYMSVAYGRFITAVGGSVLGAGADTAQQHEQSTLLGISGNDFVDAANAKTIISWGGNPGRGVRACVAVRVRCAREGRKAHHHRPAVHRVGHALRRLRSRPAGHRRRAHAGHGQSYYRERLDGRRVLRSSTVLRSW